METQSSITMRRSPERMTASLPLTHQTEAAFDPIAMRIEVAPRGGFELIDLLSGFTHAVIVDCLSLPDPVPGRIQRLTLDNVAGSARLINAHEISIRVAFDLAAKMGIEMPKTVEIFAIEGLDTSTISEEMTDPVSASVAPLARQIHAMLTSRAAAPQGD